MEKKNNNSENNNNNNVNNNNSLNNKFTNNNNNNNNNNINNNNNNTFTNKINKKIKSLKNQHFHDTNIIKAIRQKLQDNNAMITKADKGDTVVILGNDSYDTKVKDFFINNSIQ